MEVSEIKKPFSLKLCFHCNKMVSSSGSGFSSVSSDMRGVQFSRLMRKPLYCCEAFFLWKFGIYIFPEKVSIFLFCRIAPNWVTFLPKRYTYFFRFKVAKKRLYIVRFRLIIPGRWKICSSEVRHMQRSQHQPILGEL